MMLMLLLSELTRLDVKLSAEPDGLKVDAPAGVLTDELRQAMAEHKAALLRYAAYPSVETIDGLGMLTGHRQQFSIIDCIAPERTERLRYTIGVRLLHHGIERFYLPGTVWESEHSLTPSIILPVTSSIRRSYQSSGGVFTKREST